MRAAPGRSATCQLLPFPIDKARPCTKVLAEVGVVRRNEAEQAIIDPIAANAVPKCKVVQQ